jgi:hypothetical protein
MRRPHLYIGDILRWADEFNRRRGRWPCRDDGPVEGTLDLTWRRVDSALKLGNRGLRPGSSLAKLLLTHRKRRHKGYPPSLTEAQILTWADAHHARTGEWPIHTSGSIAGVRGETWRAVDRSLRVGRRGLPGGSSLAQLLEARRGVRNVQAAPPLTAKQILTWADAHHARTGSWPTRESGPIPGTAGETWAAVAQAIVVGGRGLGEPGSLAQFLARYRGVRNHMDVPPLTAGQILAWADAHYGRTGNWPKRSSGAIPDAPGEAWSAVDAALVVGVRGLPRGDSLAKFLARHRGVRNKQALPVLSVEQIRAWVEAHYARTGEWPRHNTGPIPEAPGETWAAVNTALARGGRGLPGGSSLYQVVCECRERTANHQPC